MESSVEVVESTTPGSIHSSGRIQPLHVAILGGLSALAPLSTDMYLPALPALGQELGATVAQTQLTLSAGILGLAFGQVLAGPSSDAFGRRRPLLIGIAAFAIASLLCVVAPSVEVLTLLRFVQGIAGAAGIAIALAIVSDLYADTTRARFFSVLTQVTGIAPIVAPIIGGQLLRFTTWHGVFIALALIGAVLWLAIIVGLRETLPPERRQRGGIFASLHAFGDLLRDRRFVGYALACGLAFAACIVYISVSPFVLQNIYGLSPQYFGILFGINAFGIVVAAQINGRLVDRVASQTLLGWGITAFALGCLALLSIALLGGGLVAVLPLLFVIVASMGFIVPNATTLALADTRAAGSASALLGVLQFTIGAIAAPLVGMAGTATPIPMAAAMAAFGVATLATFLVLCRPLRSARELSS